MRHGGIEDGGINGYEWWGGGRVKKYGGVGGWDILLLAEERD